MEGIIPYELQQRQKIVNELLVCYESRRRLEEKITARRGALEEHNSSEKIQKRLEGRKERIKELLGKKESKGSRQYDYFKTQIEKQDDILLHLDENYESLIKSLENKKDDTINILYKQKDEGLSRLDEIYEEKIRHLEKERDDKKKVLETSIDRKIEENRKDCDIRREKSYRKYNEETVKHNGTKKYYEMEMTQCLKEVEDEVERLEKKQDHEQLSTDENNDFTLCGLKTQFKGIEDKIQSLNEEMSKLVQIEPASFVPPKPSYKMASMKGDRICDLNVGKHTDWNADNVSIISTESLEEEKEEGKSQNILPISSLVPTRPQSVQEIQAELRKKDEYIQKKIHEREETEKYILSKDYMEEAKRKLREKDREEEENDEKEKQKEAFLRERTEKLRPEFGENIPQDFFKYPYLTVEQYYRNKERKEKKKKFIETFEKDLTEKEIEKRDELELEELDALYECHSLKEVRKYLDVEKIPKRMTKKSQKSE